MATLKPFLSAALFTAIAMNSAILPASGAAVSTFGVNAEGWSAGSFAIPVDYPDFSGGPLTTHAVTYQAAGGNPGGFVWLHDPNSNWQYFMAPAAFLGNQGAHVGGTLSFDLTRLDSIPLGDLTPLAPLAAITDGSTILVFAGTYTLPTLGSWTSYSAGLDASLWRIGNPNGATPTAGQFSAVLSNLTGLYIPADFFGGAGTNGEDIGLDNVRLSGAPEPSTWLLSASGLFGLYWLQRRRSHA